MDISKLKRNPKLVHDTLMETEDGALVTKSGCFILFPEKYISKGLASIGTEISCLAVFAIFIDDTTYAVSSATSICHLGDGIIDNVTIEDTVYTRVTFGPGDIIMKNTNLIVDGKLVNTIMDFFMGYALSPFFFNYLDMAELFLNVNYFNGLHMGDIQLVRDIMAANISRKLDNAKIPFRTGITAKELHIRPQFIPQNNIALNASSNLARLNGPELMRATRAALLDTKTTASDLEELYNE